MRDRVLSGLVGLLASATVCVLAALLVDMIVRGVRPLDLEFLTQGVRDGGRDGGIGPILLSTVLVLAVCMAVSLPVALGAAVFLSEWTQDRTTARVLVRGGLDVLAGVPSIVFGLFGNAFFGVFLGLGYSLLTGGLTLACMVLPFLVRAVEVALRAVPPQQRLAAASLGLGRAAILGRVVLPWAARDLGAGWILGVGRALSETAALLFTSGYVARIPGSLLDSGRVLSVHIYDLAMNVPGGEPRAYASALVLMGLLGMMNAGVLHLAGRWLGTGGRIP